MSQVYEATSLFFNGVEMPIGDAKLTVDSTQQDAREGDVSTGTLSSTWSATVTLTGKQSRKLFELFWGPRARRLGTPYARGRRLPKPRGRKAKALARHRWLRHLERLAGARARIVVRQTTDEIGQRLFEKWARDAGIAATRVDDDGLYEVTFMPELHDE